MNLDMTQEKLMLLLYISPLLFAQSIFLFLNAKKKEPMRGFLGHMGLDPNTDAFIILLFICCKAVS